jgi:hypothetical protein
MLRKLLRIFLFTTYTLSVGWILFFLLIELFPDILTVVQLQGVGYYALKKDYISDPKLIFVHRKTDYVEKLKFTGDSFYPEYGAKVEAIDYMATYDHHGFRKNSSTPPYDIAVIGDSYIEIGESDEKTFTELLKRETDLSTLNLGHAWYGPYQYLELLERYVLDVKPQYVFFCFFAGNDLTDMKQYKKWQAGKQYYFYKDVGNHNIISRFVMATFDTLRFLKRQAKSMILPRINEQIYLSFLGIIDVGNEKVPMFFNHWEEGITDEEFISLKSIISKFKSVSYSRQITPILIYIPTATQVYAELYSTDSNSQFIDRVKKMSGNPSLEALTMIAKQLDLDFINLLPVFKSQANKGRLLYYPYDSHWNIEGRQIAASFIASYLNNLKRVPTLHTRGSH